MMQIEIDGKAVSVEPGTSVLEAANQSGTFIPHFCYHKKLSIPANCRMCLVEVENMGKPQPACATAARDGMKIHTKSAMARGAQKGVMEFLLINHPLDCPVCDQGGECQLQDLAVGYGHSHSHYDFKKRVIQAKDMGPLVSAEEMSRCIQCTRCIRFTAEIAGYQELGMINRGEHSEIVPFIDEGITTELSGNVIDLCPVGALTSKPFRFNSRTWELSRRKSISAHDALGSNLEVQVKDKTVRRVLPRENGAINECWLSDKDRFAYEGLTHPERVHTPYIKQNNRWLKVDWPTALKYVVKGLKGVASEFGTDAIGVWAGDNNTLEELYLLKKLAKSFGIKGFDAAPRLKGKEIGALQRGALWLGQSLKDFLASDVIVIMGAYLRQDQPLLTARIRQAVGRGAKLVVIQAKKEELHIPGVVQKIVSPQEWAGVLEKIEEGDYPAVTKLIKKSSAQKISFILGEEARQHPNFAALYTEAQKVAEKYGATLGIFPNAANAVGADLLNFVLTFAADDIEQMLQEPKKAVILANVEPCMDVYHGARAKSALKEAATVIALTPYFSDELKEVADVILPIATFTETPGSFVNMEGVLQSFYSTAPVLGETKPMWKVLRVLGNLLELSGFEYQNSGEVLAEFRELEPIEKLLNNHISPAKTTSRAKKTRTPALIRVGGVTIYSTDAIVRRAGALQQTLQARVPAARVNTATAKAYGLEETVVLQQEDGEDLELDLIIDDAVADGVVYLPLHSGNMNLGTMMSPIVVKRG